jgi:hypothetical protein
MLVPFGTDTRMYEPTGTEVCTLEVWEFVAAALVATLATNRGKTTKNATIKVAKKILCNFGQQYLTSSMPVRPLVNSE